MSDERPLLVRYGPPLAPARPAAIPSARLDAVSDAIADAPTERFAAIATIERQPGQPGVAWRPLLARALRIWLWTRLLLLALTLVAAALAYARGQRALFSSPGSLLELWYRFDATAYLHIVEQGYANGYSAAFFPLYPLLIAGPAHVFGLRAALLFGMLISNLATLAALVGLLRLAVDEGSDERAAWAAGLALVAYPMAFFLGAAYTEGPFIAAVVWCLWGMRRGRWYTAAACALVAALVRPTGVILYAPLLYEFARQHGWGRQWRDQLRDALPSTCATLLASPLGVGAYSLYCALRFGDPLAWMHSEARYWGRVSMPIWQALHETGAYIVSLRPLSLAQDKKLVDYIALALVLTATVALARRQPVAFTLYLAGLLYLTLDSPFVVSASQHYAVYLSASRYMLPAIPIYLALGRWARRSPRLALACLIGGFALQAVFTIYFLSGGWVA